MKKIFSSDNWGSVRNPHEDYATVIGLKFLTNCHRMSSSIAETEAKVYGHNLSV